MTSDERLHYQILHRKKEGIEDADRPGGRRPRDPVEVLNNVLLPAMKEVGDKFGAGELILPFVLQSAEVMKKAVARLETYLERQEGVTKGTVVLATVFGDVHDIGKNLVNTILTNNGYTVHDLGKQVPVEPIIDKAVEVDATAIGLSALLVSTSKQMPLCVQELHHAGLPLPGDHRRRGDQPRPTRSARSSSTRTTPYEPGVFYAKDAFEGLSLMDRIIDPDDARRLWSTARSTRRAGRWTSPGREAFSVPAEAADTERLDRARGRAAHAAVLGRRGRWTDFALDDVWPHLDLKTLFRLHWGGKGVKDEAWEALQRDEFLPRLRAHAAGARSREGWLQPRVRYGYFPANGDGNDLVVFEPGRAGARDRPLPLPAPAAPRAPLPGRLLPAARRRAGATSSPSRS